ncbi:hypothetical protein Pst134EA_007016 [Puccinia striiformis f. sp. tritici]|uniref:hypothetical protein n=1 Tax=Puccinia striiformis f. sp. tritici TaxID=168172 RepID=UPI0020076287|nr:hypothetical protein Pst134EA_007016 [Puccinia striiformis f. sp. tritici]KAH9469738.1 hypothetical protein Pst134EA_007016 [Puccinia striiformis f. sp. tritici]
MVIHRPTLVHRSKCYLNMLVNSQWNSGAPRVVWFSNAGRRTHHLETICTSSIAWRSPLHVGISTKAFSCEASKQKLKPASDHQIKSQWIQLVNPSSTLQPGGALHDSTSTASANLLVEPALTRDVLSRLDLNRYTLIEVNSKANPPICKIVSREALIQKERTKVKQKKEQKKTNRLDNVVKEIHLTWKIETNDMNHKLKSVQQCFEKGYKVKVLINAPSKFQQIEQTQKDELLASVEEQLTGFGGELVKQETEGGS